MNRKYWIALSAVVAVLIVILALVIPFNRPKVKSLTLRYLSGPEAADVLSAQLDPGAVEGWNENAVFIRAKAKDIEAAQKILQREDQPGPQVMLRFQIIEADGFTTTDSTIAKVESVLRGLFRFKGYRLAAEAYVQAKAQSITRQTVTGAAGEPYVLNVNVHDVARRAGSTSAELSVQLNTREGQMLETSVNVPSGQTVVLGTARPSAERGAFILVVTPEIR